MRPLLLALLLLAPLARAQSDEGAIPYSDDEAQDERNRRELPNKSDSPSSGPRDETEVEAQEREQSLAAIDDPSIGLSLEFLGGVMLLDSSRGGLFDPKGMAGLRFTWEWSRTVFSNEFAREASFVDVTWSHAANGEGTTLVNSTANYHYFSFAPAVSFPFGPKSPAAFFAQLGVGAVFNSSNVTINQLVTPISGAKLLFQYGVGFRFRPLVVTWGRTSGANSDFAHAEDGMRVSFRIELTRFRRGYIDDTFVGGSAGVTF